MAPICSVWISRWMGPPREIPVVIPGFPGTDQKLRPGGWASSPSSASERVVYGR